MNDVNVKALRRKGLKAHQAGDLTTARKFYEEVLQHAPRDADALHLLGMVNAQEGDFEAAVDKIRYALEIDPDNALFHNHFANSLKALGQYDKAMFHYKRALELVPDYAEVHNNLGGLYQKIGDTENALRQYAKALSINPAYITAHENLGALFMRQGKFDEARRQYNNVLELHPTSVNAHYQLGTIALQKNDLQQAEINFKKVLKDSPDHTFALNNLGVLYLKRGELQKAVDTFTQALAIDDAHVDARSNIAATFLHYDRFENAITHYEEYIKHKPNDTEALYNLGVAYMAIGQHRTAEHYFKQTLEIDNTHQDALLNLSALMLQTHQRGLAQGYLKQLMALNPEHPLGRYLFAALENDQSFERAPEAYIRNLFDNYARHYEKHLVETLRYRVPNVISEYLKETLSIEPASLRILDLGCGSGLSGVAVSTYAKSLVGVDLSAKMLALACEKKIYSELVDKDIEAYLAEIQDARFDLVIAADTLIYFGDLHDIIKALARVLTPGGRFIFTVEQGRGDGYELMPSARYTHAKSYVEALLSEVGFDIECCREVDARSQEGEAVKEWLFVCRYHA